MNKKIIFTVSFILISLFATAQKDINTYKYIIVPKSFDFTKGEDQYQLNSLTKFLFNKYGYEAYFVDDELPEDLKQDICLALVSEVSNEKKSMFKTKLEIILKDCFGTIIMTSEIGESRLKDYNKAYVESLRMAFTTYQNLDYKYVPKDQNESETEKTSVKPKDKKVTEIVGGIKVVESVTVEKAKVIEESVDLVTEQPNDSSLFYAQPIDNGYQLVNSEPKIVMILLSTAAENVFIVKDKNAIVFKEDGFWYYSENNGKLNERESISIKF